PQHPAADVKAPARSFLNVNCSHCHQFGAGGTADFDLRFDKALDETKTLEVRPTQGTFEIPGAQILAPGDPSRSVLYYRVSKLGRGRMPHIGSEMVADRGLRLLHDWIRQRPLHKDEPALLDGLRALDEPSALAHEKEEWDKNLEQRAREIAKKHNREAATAEDRSRAESQLKAAAAERVKKRAAD